MKKQQRSALNFLFMSVCFFLTFISCRHSSKDSKPQVDIGTEDKPKIEFNMLDISCKKEGLSGSGGVSVSTGDVVELGSNLSFTAKVTGTTTIKSWKINDNVQENQTQKTFSYKVKKEDVKDGKIKVSIEKNGDVNTEDKTKIEFDEDLISCTKGGGFLTGGQTITSGSEVELGSSLSFTAKVTGTTTIKSWKINDNIQENQTKKTFSYKVKKEDVKDGKIKVSIEKNQGFPIVVEYDDKIIKCSKSSLLSSTPVPSKSNVEVGDVITFTGTPSQNKAIESWFVNNTEKGKGDKLTYTVVASDCVKEGDKLVIRFSFSERELKKIKISFDTAKVQCNELGTLLGQGNPILNESELLEGKKVVFSAKKGKYEDVKEWLVKGVSKQTGSDTFNYTVDIKDADSDEKIVVSWTISHKVKVEFNKKRITCKTKSLAGFWENNISSGQFHSEGKSLYLYPNLAEGEKFEGWYLNGKKHISVGGLFLDNIIYKVSSSDAIDKDGYKYIEITTKTEFLQKIQIKFDESKLECKYGDQIIHNEESIWDKTKLIFKVKAEDKGASNWYINAKKKTIGTSMKRFEYVMYADQAEVQGNKKVMNITFDEIPLKKITLNFASNIECKNEAEEKVINGSSLYEGEILTFVARLDEDSSIGSWQMGNKKINKTTPEIVYTLSLSDAAETGGVFTLNVSVNTLEKIKVSFDSQTIICEVSDGALFSPKYTTVQSGESLNVGSFLRFTLVKAEKFKDSFSKWLVNGNEKSGNKDYKKFTYTLDSNDAILSGTKKEVVVTIVEKSLEERVIIKFDADKMKCKKDYENFKTDNLAYKGDKLEFTASLKEGFEVVNWKVGDSEKLDQKNSKFSYIVSLADAKLEGSDKVIKISYSEKELPKHHIVFEPSKVKCKKANIDVSSDDEVHEKVSLTFKATLNKGEALEAWYINDEKQTNQTSTSFTYKVAGNDAKIDSGKSKIKISYKLKEKIKIIFDASSMSCKIPGLWSSSNVNSGDLVLEGEKLVFTAILENGKKVKVWKKNGEVIAEQNDKPTYSYKLSLSDAVDNGGVKELRISVELE